jgi:hypothetical protein
MVSGLVKTRDFSGRRKFVQTFFLAPQEKGYFVLNDIFQFIDEGITCQHQVPIPSESKYDTQLNASSPLPEPPGNAFPVRLVNYYYSRFCNWNPVGFILDLYCST